MPDIEMHDVFEVGLLAARPASAPTREGALYYATDTDLLYRDNGTTWDTLSMAPPTHVHAGADITSGTVADARIDAALARDSEVTTAISTHEADTTSAHKLDDLTAPDDNTDLNATTGAHGLLPKLGGGTTNFLRADGSWNAPPGAGAGGATELDYVPITANVSLTATTEGTAHTVVTGTSQAYAAVPTIVEFFSPQIEVEDTVAAAVVVLLFDGGTVIGRMGVIINPASAVLRFPVTLRYRLTPTAATHQYIIKAYTTAASASATIGAGAGGTGTLLPAFIRITTGGSGNVATDAIWDAAGDLAQGTGANTAAKLGAGTAGQFLMSGGAAAANVWASRELAYNEFTANVLPLIATHLSAATAITVVASSSVAYDGTPVIVEFFATNIQPGSGAGSQVILELFEDATDLGILGSTRASGANDSSHGGAKRRLTPSAASHVYTVKAWVTVGNGQISAGAGGASTSLPGFIRITRVA